MPSRSSFKYLTTPTAVFIFSQNLNIMNEKQKAKLIAEAENVEAIKDFFKEWWSVEQLYEAEAKAALALLHLMELPQRVLSTDELKALNEALNQHKMMVEHLKEFAGKEDEV
jgi:hypothetical protein